MHPASKAKQQLEAIHEAATLIDEDDVIVVEGENDRLALEELGLANTFVMIKGTPLYKVVEKVVEQGKRTLLLTDLDAQGKKLYRYLYHHLGQQGVHFTSDFREFLFRETPIRQVEDLSPYMRTLHKRIEYG